jgi:two-component system response regulator BaeR
MSSRIMIVEDEPELAALISDYLKHADYMTEQFHDGMLALQALRERLPDLLVLDLMLPGMDGVTLCRTVREFSAVPIIMVTARADEIDRLLGLETGADDYLCKPFSPRELVARVKAILRRAAPQEEPSAVRIDEAGQRVMVGSKVLDLTPREFCLLATLLRRPGQVFSRAQLLDQANPDNLDVTDRAIDSHIKNIRRKLAAFYPDAEIVASVYGVGYRFDFPG